MPPEDAAARLRHDPFDPVALAARLAEAKERRNRAIAERKAKGGSAPDAHRPMIERLAGQAPGDRRLGAVDHSGPHGPLPETGAPRLDFDASPRPGRVERWSPPPAPLLDDPGPEGILRGHAKAKAIAPPAIRASVADRIAGLRPVPSARPTAVSAPAAASVAQETTAAPARSWRIATVIGFMAGSVVAVGGALLAPPDIRERVAGWIAPDDGAPHVVAPDPSGPDDRAPEGAAVLAADAAAPLVTVALPRPAMPASTMAASLAQATQGADEPGGAPPALVPELAQPTVPGDGAAPASGPMASSLGRPDAVDRLLVPSILDPFELVIPRGVVPLGSAADAVGPADLGAERLDLRAPSIPSIPEVMAALPAPLPGQASPDSAQASEVTTGIFIPIDGAARSPLAEGGLADLRVVVHFPASASGQADAALGALEAAGVASARGVGTGLSISQSNVRFFHSQDAAAARQVADILAAQPGAGSVLARDFTDFRPLPEAGMVEVWLAGAPAAVAVPATAPPPAAPPAAAQPRPQAPAAAAPRTAQPGAARQAARERAPARAPAPAQGSGNTAAQQDLAQEVKRLLVETLQRMERR